MVVDIIHDIVPSTVSFMYYMCTNTVMCCVFVLTGVQFEATEVATEESEDSEVGRRG